MKRSAMLAAAMITVFTCWSGAAAGEVPLKSCFGFSVLDLEVTGYHRLTGDSSYHDVTVYEGATLDTCGFDLRVSGVLTNLGTITDDCRTGQSGGPGAPGGDGGRCWPRPVLLAEHGEDGNPGTGRGGCGGAGGGGGGAAYDELDPGADTCSNGGKGGTGGEGGDGGGRVWIRAAILDNSGVIDADGEPGGDGFNGQTGGDYRSYYRTLKWFDLLGGGGGGGGGGDGGNGGEVDMLAEEVVLHDWGTMRSDPGEGGDGGTRGLQDGYPGCSLQYAWAVRQEFQYAAPGGDGCHSPLGDGGYGGEGDIGTVCSDSAEPGEPGKAGLPGSVETVHLADFDEDWDVDAQDYDRFVDCFTGSNGGPVTGDCLPGDMDCDDDIDCWDWDAFKDAWDGPPPDVPRYDPCEFSPWLEVSKAALDWTTIESAIGYDVIQGDLGLLRDHSGDFSVAVEQCVADNHPANNLPYTDEPVVGQGFFLLVRAEAAESYCMTYDSYSAGQAASRDDGIRASSHDCPCGLP